MNSIEEVYNEAMQDGDNSRELSDDELNKEAGGSYEDDESYEYQQAVRKAPHEPARTIYLLRLMCPTE